MRKILLGLITLPWLAGCSVFGVNTVEEARYQLRSADGDFEIRDYAPLVTVETVVQSDWDNAGSQAFQRLFRYISGDNVSATEIAMTAPVIAAEESAGERIEMTTPVLQQASESGWRYQFVLPASYTIDTAPQPLDELVALREEPARTVAALRFSGLVNEQDIRQQTARLQQWIGERGLSAAAPPRWAGYNPPWTLPFLRRNEILIELN